ncbi:ATP-dependent zinc protease [Thalassotalea ponticola]|uniref:ATP-dependent zinc protease family protein n=1 Tax=Thalassotalea ponticola TaxID=1523392 RepID=UPI0025B52115|nr:ATP-dependent zinc protease [Thalassotalea ponticola]MDN3653747.1 ATP-dependent zinc protease [Thalassotalea ponticola]
MMTSEPHPKTVEQINTLQNSLQRVETNLSTAITSNCQQDNNALLEDFMTRLEQQQQPSPKEIVYVERCTAEQQTQAAASSNPATANNSGKFTVGAVESVYFSKEKLRFDARIDTGAVTSSLGVYNETRFERDGDKWVRFQLEDKEDALTYEYPVERIIRIIQQTSSSADRRPVIKMRFKLGQEKYRAEFSLADRDHLDYQVLIGREFLTDIAVVDVSAKYLQGGE